MSRNPTAPFRVPVGDLLGDPGRRRDLPLDIAADWRLELSRTDPGEPLRGTLTLEGVSGGVFATGRVGAVVIHTCNRCLSEWREEVEVSIAELLGGEGEDYPIEDEAADLEPPLRDAFLLEVPLLPLCRPDCRGLCATCGADLNTGACRGHDEEPDTPFSVLRELLEP